MIQDGFNIMRDCASNNNYGDALIDRLAVEVAKAKSYAKDANDRNEEIRAEGGHVLNDIAAMYAVPLDQIHIYPSEGGDAIVGHYYVYNNNGIVEVWKSKIVDVPYKPNTTDLELLPSVHRGGMLLTEAPDDGWDFRVPVTDASVFQFTMNKRSVTVELQKVPTTPNRTMEVTLIMTQGVGSTEVRWPDNIKWANGRAPIFSYQVGSVNIVILTFVDGDPDPYGYFIKGWM